MSRETPKFPSEAPTAPSTPTIPAPIDLAAFASNATASSDVPDAGPRVALDDALELPERAFFRDLDARARRAELMSALLQAKGMSVANAVRAIQANLGAISVGARDASLDSLAALADALRSSIAHLGIGTPADDDAQVVDTLVLDESEVSRDLVALAVEGHGHTVRCASSHTSFLRELELRRPGLIITEAGLSNAPPRLFCTTLRELVGPPNIPVVLFSDIPEAELAEAARTVGAVRRVYKGAGLDRLSDELAHVYDHILTIRSTGARRAFRL